MTARRIDRYEVLDTLESCGLVEIHLAQHEETKQKLILETISPEVFPNRRRAERWLDDVRSLRTLRHANVMMVLDADRNGGFYVAREWVAGQSLAALLDAGWTFDGLQAAQIGAGLAEGLAYLHRNGRSHGAVSPQNVVLGTDGEIRLAGLGSVVLPGRMHHDFVAPEVLSGGTPGRAADIYSLGAVLRRMYNGSEPWSPSGSRPSPAAAMPDPLNALIHTLMAEDPTNRPRSVGVAAEMLQAMVRRALPEPEPLPDEDEVIDLTPDFLLRMPDYVVKPAARAEEAPVRSPAAVPSGQPGPAASSKRRLRPRYRRIARGIMAAAFVGISLAGWRVFGSFRPAPVHAEPATPAAQVVPAAGGKSASGAAALSRRETSARQTLDAWARSWGDWRLHAGFYAPSVARFHHRENAGRDIVARYRRLESRRQGRPRLQMLGTAEGADGSVTARVRAEWPEAAAPTTLVLRLRQVRGNWRICDERAGAGTGDLPAPAQGDGERTVRAASLPGSLAASPYGQ